MKNLDCFVQLGLNEADTQKSNSKLIYTTSEQGGWHEAMLIKR
jgi:hypothetical protein